MSRKEWVLLVLVLVLGGLYVVYFTGLFGPRTIRIEHTTRSLREAYGSGGQRVEAGARGQLGNVTFALHGDYELTSVKVVSADDAQTNQYPHPLWHLVSRQGSKPVDGLCYGMPVPGMNPDTPGLEAQPLLPGREYRLLVEAHSWKGTHDFVIPTSTSTR